MNFLIAPNAFKGTCTALEAVSMLEAVLEDGYSYDYIIFVYVC
jgi:glycerate kinase